MDSQSSDDTAERLEYGDLFDSTKTLSRSSNCSSFKTALGSICEAPTLEILPFELRDLILLNMPDLESLRSLVHASPVMHDQYRKDRGRILRACVEHEMDGFLIDAYACYSSQACYLKPGVIRDDDDIIAFLDLYRLWLSEPEYGSSSFLDTVMTALDGFLHWIASFHRSTVLPLARFYSSWALANLEASCESALPKVEGPAHLANPQSPTAGLDTTLSRSEEIRIFRAFYRHETFTHLFGNADKKRSGSLMNWEINKIFFDVFEPWEAEAVSCVDVFIRLKYEDVMAEVKRDLEISSPVLFDFEIDSDHWMDGTLSGGLCVARQTFFVQDHETLFAKMRQSLKYTRMVDAPLRDAVSMSAQLNRLHEGDDNERDWDQFDGDVMSFHGDHVPPNRMHPPLAWVLLWSGQYHNLYGEFIPPSLSRMGWVFWDERRWTQTAPSDLIVKQWETAPELLMEIDLQKKLLGLLIQREDDT